MQSTTYFKIRRPTMQIAHATSPSLRSESTCSRTQAPIHHCRSKARSTPSCARTLRLHCGYARSGRSAEDTVAPAAPLKIRSLRPLRRSHPSPAAPLCARLHPLLIRPAHPARPRSRRSRRTRARSADCMLTHAGRSAAAAASAAATVTSSTRSKTLGRFPAMSADGGK